LKLLADGGTAESVIDEENGHLLSMIMRQYFMSLKILGRWKKWSPTMGKHFASVHEELHQIHPIRSPIEAGEKTYSSTDHLQQGQGVPSLVGHAMRATKRRKQDSNGHPADDAAHLSDSEDDSTEVRPVPTESSDPERSLVVVLAQGHAQVVETGWYEGPSIVVRRTR
jgi:5'-nucleotidase